MFRTLQRVVVCAALLVAVLVVAPAPPVTATPAQSPGTYTNPVSGGRLQDPFIVRSDSTYYAYVSGFDFGLPFFGFVRESTDLVNWTNVGTALSGPGAWADASTGYNVTSPSVAHVPSNATSEQWVMYYTAVQSGTSTTCIGVATAPSPEVPFTPDDAPLICPPGGAEDPSAFQLWGYQLTYVSGDTVYNQRLESSGLAVAGSPYELYTAGAGWWQEGVVDRPAVALGDGAAHLLFSGGAADTSARAMGWAPCRTFWTVVVDCSSPTHLGTWVEGDDTVTAPSGAQVFSDATGAQWITYDARSASGCTETGCTENPSLRIDKLCFAHSFPRTNAPSTTAEELARDSGDCSTDVPGAPLDIEEGDVVDDGTVVPLALDGNVTTAAHGRALWVFGDRFDCGNRDSNWGGFGVPNASATGPEFVEDTPCPHQGIIPRTQAEIDYSDTHWADCTPPPGGSCERSRIVLWSGGAVALPDGGAWVTFTKAIEYWDKTEDDGWTFRTWEEVGVGAVNVSRADIDAGVAVADRGVSASPVGCGESATTAAGCLFDLSIDETVSDQFANPLADDGYVYMMSSAKFDWSDFWNPVQVAWPKLARAPIDQVDDVTAWRYWTGPGTDDWSTTNDYAEAEVLPSSDLVVGTLTYNPHLDRFVNVNAFLGSANARTATSLTGSWSAAEPLFSGVRCSTGAFAVRTFAQHSALTTGGGRTLPITYFTDAGDECPGQPSQLRWVTVGLD